MTDLGSKWECAKGDREERQKWKFLLKKNN